jgi:hypothetical protein
LDLLRLLAEENPSLRFRLVVGSDILGEVHRWQRWDEIVRDFEPLVVGRQGYPAPEGSAALFPGLSSTELRGRLQRGEPIQGLVPQALEAELVAHFRGAPLRRSALLERAGYDHGFTLRPGGSGPDGQLDLRPREGPELEEDWRRVLLRLGAAAEDLTLVSQVHGSAVLEEVPAGGCRRTVGEGDALVSRRAGQVVAVRVADCVPLLLAAGRSVAAVHAGWRGLAAGVIEAAVTALRDGTREPVVAAIGPCAGPGYEVGPEVVQALQRRGAGAESLRAGRGDRSFVDLRRVAERQLEAVGVRSVDQVPGDTLVDPDLWSHRRGGAQAGRAAGLIRCPA